MIRANFIGFSCGKRGSGKSYLLARYSAKFPKRIVLDPLGEYLGAYEGASECGTLDETIDALEANLLTKAPRWTVVACIEPSDVAKLAGALAPVGSLSGGYSRAVGGVVLECGEVDTIAPNNAGIAPEIRNLFQRGRHYRVSVLAATQRPRDVHRVVTSQADALWLFRQHELRDLDYIAKNTSEAVADVVKGLPQYHHVRYLPNVGTCEVVNEKGIVTKRVDLFDGATVLPGETSAVKPGPQPDIFDNTPSEETEIED